MEKLSIEATSYTPGILFDPESNILTIEGDSYPENTAEFYEPVFTWLENFQKNPEEQELQVHIEIIYFNSSSSKVLMNVFDILENEAKKGKQITVDWIYDEENEHSLEYGEEFLEDLDTLKFNLKKKPHSN